MKWIGTGYFQIDGRTVYYSGHKKQRRKDADFIDRKNIGKIEFGTTNKEEDVVDEFYDQSEMCTSNRTACG